MPWKPSQNGQTAGSSRVPSRAPARSKGLHELRPDAINQLFLNRATEFIFYPAGAHAGDREVHHFAIRAAKRGKRKFALIHMGNF